MHFYDIYGYGRMIEDAIRTDAYAKALHQSIRADSIVLDIGTGVGIWALLACKFGARKVYAADPNDVIHLAREVAGANGYADRIEFIQDMTTRIVLPEPASVIVTDMHGVLPIFEQSIASIIDARKRLLAAGGVLIPREERLWAVVVEASKAYQDTTRPWVDDLYGLDMKLATRLTTNQWRGFRGSTTPWDFLTEPKCWAVLDYQALDSPNVRGEALWRATRAGAAHGVLVWFDAHLADGVTISNSPSARKMIFGQGFFPWPQPVALSVGDRISIVIRADLTGGDYIWSWETVVCEEQGGRKAEFKQSTFLGMSMSAARLQKRASSYVPLLNEDGDIARLVLSLMDGKNSLEEIASQTKARFPGRFKDWRQALALVADLSDTHSRPLV